MAEKDFAFDDPFEGVGVKAPVEGEGDPDEIMVRCFVEEYALLGMGPGNVLRLFESETFAGTHRIYQLRGRAFVRRIVAEVFRLDADWEPEA